MSQSFVGNIYDDPVVWKPEVRFNLDDKSQVVAVVDPETGKVTNVEEAPLVKFAADTGKRAFASDYYAAQVRYRAYT